jgi:drug/metabolite transporter (DMT)-like permease
MLAYLAAFAGVCGHASSEFVVKLTQLQGAEVSVWRFMLGGAALVLVSLARPQTRDLITPLRNDFLPVVGLSVFGMAFAQFLFHWALDYASVVQVATMVTTMPIFVVFVLRLVDGTPITAPKLVSGIGAFLGCLFLLTDGVLDRLEGGGSSLPGILLAIGCALVGAFYLVLVRPWIKKHGAIRMTTYTFALGAVAMWLVAGGLWGIWVDPTTLFDRPGDQAAALITLGIWNTCIGFILWLWGLGNVPDPARGNYLFFLKPVIAAFLAFFILGDSITWPQFLAIAAITGFVLGEMFYDDIRALLRRKPADAEGK